MNKHVRILSFDLFPWEHFCASSCTPSLNSLFSFLLSFSLFLLQELERSYQDIQSRLMQPVPLSSVHASQPFSSVPGGLPRVGTVIDRYPQPSMANASLHNGSLATFGADQTPSWQPQISLPHGRDDRATYPVLFNDGAMPSPSHPTMSSVSTFRLQTMPPTLPSPAFIQVQDRTGSPQHTTRSSVLPVSSVLTGAVPISASRAMPLVTTSHPVSRTLPITTSAQLPTLTAVGGYHASISTSGPAMLPSASTAVSSIRLSADQDRQTAQSTLFR